ncbi:MAG TPA: hypothetical protein PK018_05845 [Candidatus Competibacter sp.]|nr:hypothetical protein [Candidatus Competibacteraceae bacterium]HPE71682.1 hypothetical protein [Candidatus Competibacter sp.]HRX71734.1 hypothetical protein [Candidatus Competibacteraceae bacterium]
MQIIINDSSALIDLAKTRLLENLLQLPYRFVIPDVLYADELITLRYYHREQLVSPHHLSKVFFSVCAYFGQATSTP